jgi:hypothetical protein
MYSYNIAFCERGHKIAMVHTSHNIAISVTSEKQIVTHISAANN